jgi:hypothetical protein
MTKQDYQDDLYIQLEEMSFGELQTLCDAAGIKTDEDMKYGLITLLVEHYTKINFN